VLVYTRNAVVVLEQQMGIDRLCPKLPNHDEARSGVEITSGLYLHILSRDA
jgi:hypothetical protein